MEPMRFRFVREFFAVRFCLFVFLLPSALFALPLQAAKPCSRNLDSNGNFEP